MQVVVIRCASPAVHSAVNWRAIDAEVNALGHVLRPMHQSVHDPELSRFFVVEVADRAAGEALVRVLRPLPGVDSVYLKPSDSTP